MVNITAPLKDRTWTIFECFVLSIKSRLVWLCVFPSGKSKCIYQCCVVETLYSWQILNIISTLSNSALNMLIKFSRVTSGADPIHAPIPHKSYPLYYHFGTCRHIRNNITPTTS
jgi:hypothetical protein